MSYVGGGHCDPSESGIGGLRMSVIKVARGTCCPLRVIMKASKNKTTEPISSLER